jgi:hypothetical protein
VRSTRAQHRTAEKGLTLPQESAKVFCISVQSNLTRQQMANTMHPTAAYCYFYYFAFDPGGKM